jgi:hypothetical protein
MGRDLLCKLRAQITFDGTAALRLRGPEAKTLILTVAQEEWLYAPKGRPLEIPELSFKIPGIWAEDTPQIWPKMCPQILELKLEVTLPALQGSGQNSKTL